MRQPNVGIAQLCMASCAALALTACGGSGSGPPVVAPPPATGLALTRVSGPTAYTATCNGTPQIGTLYLNAEVEPYVAVNPANPANLIGVWQQDRWSNGSAQALATAVSFDGGSTWTTRPPPTFSRCAGSSPGSTGDYQRATDPWVTFSADGTAHQIALAASGGVFQAGSANAILTSRSGDGGLSWSAPIALISDGAGFFSDKESITADCNDPAYVYAVWDRLDAAGGGPTYFARTVDGGLSWQPAHAIYDPGGQSQTIGNQIVSLPNGVLVLALTQIDTLPNGSFTAFYAVLRSTDRGDTWSAPVRVADVMALGARVPETGFAIRDGSLLATIAVGANGQLAMVWQDSRFSNGVVDGIAFSRSSDGGTTWSQSVGINADPAVSAFTPAVFIAGDGSYVVSYYDFRENTSNAATLLTSYWMTSSGDGINWSERKVFGPFDLAFAPNAGGLFVGDYQSGAMLDNEILLFFARTNSDPANRSDIFSTRTPFATTQSAQQPSMKAAAVAAGFTASPSLKAGVSEMLKRTVAEERQPRRQSGRKQRR